MQPTYLYPIFPLLHQQRSNEHNGTPCHERRHPTLLNYKVCFASSSISSHAFQTKMSYLPNLCPRPSCWMELTDPLVSVCYRRAADGRCPLHEADVISMPSSPQQDRHSGLHCCSLVSTVLLSLSIFRSSRIAAPFSTA